MRLLVTLLAATILLCVGCSGGDSESPSPTPTSAAETEIAPGVFIRTETPPPLPEGATAVSQYYVFRNNEDTGVVIGVALTKAVPDSVDLGFYTYDELGQWLGVIGAIQLQEGGTVLQGAFPAVPTNVIVLDWPEGKEP